MIATGFFRQIGSERNRLSFPQLREFVLVLRGLFVLIQRLITAGQPFVAECPSSGEVPPQDLSFSSHNLFIECPRLVHLSPRDQVLGPGPQDSRVVEQLGSGLKVESSFDLAAGRAGQFSPQINRCAVDRGVGELGTRSRRWKKPL